MCIGGTGRVFVYKCVCAKSRIPLGTQNCVFFSSSAAAVCSIDRGRAGPKYNNQILDFSSTESFFPLHFREMASGQSAV